MTESNNTSLLCLLILALAEAREKEEIATEQSKTDYLTGLPNYRAFMEQFNEELSRGRRHGHSLTLMMFDFDKFKLINSALTHAGSNKFLREFSALLPKILRAYETVFRYAGDEFTILLPQAQEEDIEAIVKRVNDLATMMGGMYKGKLDGLSVSVTFAHINVQLSQGSRETAEELCEIASRMLLNKKALRDAVEAGV